MESRPPEALAMMPASSDLEVAKAALRRSQYLKSLSNDVMSFTGIKDAIGSLWLAELQQERRYLAAEADLALLAHRGRLQ